MKGLVAAKTLRGGGPGAMDAIDTADPLGDGSNLNLDAGSVCILTGPYQEGEVLTSLRYELVYSTTPENFPSRIVTDSDPARYWARQTAYYYAAGSNTFGWGGFGVDV